MSNVTILPAGELLERVRATKVVDFSSVSSLFMFATRSGISRAPIADLVSSAEGCVLGSRSDLAEFCLWCRRIDFQVHERVPKIPQAVDPVSNTLGDDLFKLGIRAGEEYADAQARRYGFFRPGWQVESARWRDFFGHDDPCEVIGFYLSSFFKANHPSTKNQTLFLEEYDLVVLNWLFKIEKFKNFSHLDEAGDEALAALASAFATACGLERALLFSANWENPNFLHLFDVCCELLPEIGSGLLEYWACRADFFREEKPKARQLAIDQATTVSRIVISYLMRGNIESKRRAQFPEFISDATLLGAIDRIGALEIDFDATELKPVVRDIALALYRARDPVFAGVFPFGFDRAKDVIGCLSGERGMWIADFSYYDGEDYDARSDLYLLKLSDPSDTQQSSDFRTDDAAIRRFRAYRDALDEIEAEGLVDLSGAWWAFFLASQALGFPGLGVPVRDLSKIAEVTERLASDRRVQAAAKFAIEQEQGRKISSRSRNCAAVLAKAAGIAQGNQKEINSSVTEVVVTRKKAEKFLEDTLGRETWLRLARPSRSDIIEVECYWSIAYRDFGAGRSDWGALISLYSRPVEAEMRTHIGPLIEQWKELGLCDPLEFSLGGCFSAIRSVLKKVADKGEEVHGAELHSRLQALRNLALQHGGFMTDVRNRANHGNRVKPVSELDFLRWREIIFRNDFFGIVLGCSPPK